LKTEMTPEGDLYIPNAFTPDGDGMNDEFVVIYDGLSIVDFRWSIFDRWGMEVFTTDNMSKGWDGKKDGKPCPGGIYVYIIRYTLESIQGEQLKKGNVMLIK